jgi:hypothetical protein
MRSGQHGRRESQFAVAGTERKRRHAQGCQRPVVEFGTARHRLVGLVTGGRVSVWTRLTMREARSLHLAQGAKQQKQHGEKGE